MKPIDNFHPDVQRLTSGNEHTDHIDILPIRYEYLNGGNVMVTVWKVGWRDLLRMLLRRRLYLCVMGERWPPLFIETDKQYTGIDEYSEMKREEARTAV
jgi:hypothetical protein